jgi:quercetin dioxygenase-like cupin family protein
MMPVVDPVRALEAALRDMDGRYDVDELTTHHFCDGLYGRQVTLPAGTIAVGKVHAERNFFFVLAGELILATPEGPVRVAAPFMAVTDPGTKRAVYALTDCICMNVHPNPDDERDLARLESRYITPEALPAPEAQERLE